MDLSRVGMDCFLFLMVYNTLYEEDFFISFAARLEAGNGTSDVPEQCVVGVADAGGNFFEFLADGSAGRKRQCDKHADRPSVGIRTGGYTERAVWFQRDFGRCGGRSVHAAVFSLLGTYGHCFVCVNVDCSSFQPAAFASRVYGFPFILSVWLLLWGCSWLQPGLLLVSDGAVPLSCDMDGLQAFGQGIGQVMFQDSLLSGLLFLAGILVHSRIAAAYTLLGVLLPIPLAVVLGADAGTLNAGLMGYNGVLCAIALGGTTWRSCVWASCAVLLSVVLQMVGMEWGVTTLTAPFVLSVWLVMGAKRMFGK